MFATPTTPGVNIGDTQHVPCLASNTLTWTWHLGNRECSSREPHLTTDLNTQCTCLLFADDFNCRTNLGIWQVESGSLTIEPDTPLFYGTAYWTWTGTQWAVSANQCLFNCNPVAPTITPVWTESTGYGPGEWYWNPSALTTPCVRWVRQIEHSGGGMHQSRFGKLISVRSFGRGMVVTPLGRGTVESGNRGAPRG